MLQESIAVVNLYRPLMGRVTSEHIQLQFHHWDLCLTAWVFWSDDLLTNATALYSMKITLIWIRLIVRFWWFNESFKNARYFIANRCSTPLISTFLSGSHGSRVFVIEIELAKLEKTGRYAGILCRTIAKN